MPPLVWAGLAVVGLIAGKNFLEEANESGKLVLYAGGAYVGYKVLKQTGALK